MRNASVDYQFNTYGARSFKFSFWASMIHFCLGGAVHGFTVPGDRYNEKADLRSWAAMSQFWQEVFL